MTFIFTLLYLATSLGDDLGGISQMEKGVCQSHQMKLKVKVHRGGKRFENTVRSSILTLYLLDIEGPQRIPDDYSEEIPKPYYEYHRKFLSLLLQNHPRRYITFSTNSCLHPA